MSSGLLQHHLFAGGSGDNPLGQPFAHPLENVCETRGLILALGREADGAQPCLDRAGSSLHAPLYVAEDIDVLGGPVDDPAGD